MYCSTADSSFLKAPKLELHELIYVNGLNQDLYIANINAHKILFQGNAKVYATC